MSNSEIFSRFVLRLVVKQFNQQTGETFKRPKDKLRCFLAAHVIPKFTVWQPSRHTVYHHHLLGREVENNGKVERHVGTSNDVLTE
jgi:hypothetical protein